MPAHGGEPDPDRGRLSRRLRRLLERGGRGDPELRGRQALSHRRHSGGQTFNIKTYVIGFAGADTAALDHIATCGGSGASFSTANETQISQALSTIISGAIKPETCDNTDNNCNGCTDEGFTHFCDVQPVPANCCAWTTDPQRQTCLTTYQATITPGNPQGDVTKLPCTTPAQAKDPQHWLCYDPGERCDNVDNNCELNNGNGTADEGVTKCGSPLHCPQPETCNGQDDDCDGVIDNGGVCGTCVPSGEVCDGCDNNCNKIVDDGVPDIPCGFTGPGEPAYCAGTQTCKLKGTPVPTAGQCLPGGGYSACNFPQPPQAEVCNGLDDDCNGIIDDNIPSIPCVPPGTPGGLVYDTMNPASICHKGHTVCTGGATQCVGFIGPQPEVCDGLDNNCDGSIDNGVPGVGLACGVNQPPCTPGLTACVNGSLVCQGGVMPQPEICDGIDNNCNGQIDESPLVDGPGPGMNGCWDDPPANCATPCQFPNPPTPGGPPPLKWCAPPGATCNDIGTLTMPCHTGTLTCKGAQGWSCTNDKEPSPEVCDGIDNDCNGLVDDGNVMNVGQNCGIDGPVEPDGTMGPCRHGQLVCNAGVLSCVGGVGPSMEICDGIDNDCNGLIDDGLPIGGACTPDYDHNEYPGDRSAPPCQPGHLQCCTAGMMPSCMPGSLVCVGGVGPQPEVCDGIDNDCDGQVDEVGTAPDGIDGTTNPETSPECDQTMSCGANIGDACGMAQGACMAGTWACMNGEFYCKGQTTGMAETCNCQDDDCDGHIDNKNPNNDPPLCSPGKDCVKGPAGCQCAKKGCPEVGCPPGQECATVTDPDTGANLGQYCVTNPDATCGDCSTKTVTDKTGKTICAPAGTVLDNCITPPVCVCQGQAGCQDPCLGVTCGTGQVCAETGAKAGKCVDDNCFNVLCQGCGKACNLGSCVDTDCSPNPCPNNKPVCVPTFPTGHTCEKSCADVDCPSGQQCEEGVCKKTCDPDCAKGKYCDETQNPPKCVDDPCPKNGCSDGSCCDHKTGSCGENCPCNGVVCPAGQVCKDNSCFDGQQGTGGGGGSASASSGNGGANTTSTGTSQASGAGGAGAGNTGVFGLATGGGGCQCEIGDEGSPAKGFSAALVALVIGLARRRRRRDEEEVDAVKEVRS